MIKKRKTNNNKYALTEKQEGMAFWLGYMAYHSPEIDQIITDIYIEIKTAINYASIGRIVVILSEQQNHRCCYCGKHTWLFDKPDNEYCPNERKGVSVMRKKAKRPNATKFIPDRLPHMTKRDMATIDHIIPKSDGGGNQMDNFVMCCYRCNTIRGKIPAMTFWQILQNEMFPLTEYKEIGYVPSVKKIFRELVGT